jgi:preprotein translocase subunit Sec61beta
MKKLQISPDLIVGFAFFMLVLLVLTAAFSLT